jgi:ubiquinone/menaquinone biosynthesis C-methylase UbiE
MLAPRKKLWTSPREALQLAIEALEIKENDVVYDIGCGDGSFLFLCKDFLAKKYEFVDFSPSQGGVNSALSSIRVIGVDIEEERILAIRRKLSEDSEISLTFPGLVTVIHSNALELTYSDGTCFYLYLVSRGLKQIIDILLRNITQPFRVVTFMYPIPNQTFLRSYKVHSEKHDGSQWPLFYYEFSPAVVTPDVFNNENYVK